MKRPSATPLKRAALCAVTAGLLFAAPAVALASDQSAVDAWSDALKASMSDAYSAYNSEGTTAAATKTFPSELDLRDKGVVTPVKNQGDANTCWAHAAIAASETSILSELGTTYAQTGFDLSERYLAYFAYITATEVYAGAAQAGEGFVSNEATPSPSGVLMAGGFQTGASTLFSAGIGPVLESTAPYKSDAGLITCRVYDEYTKIPLPDLMPDYKIPSTYYLTWDQIQVKKAEWDAKGFEYTISNGYAVNGVGLDDPGWGLEYTLYGQSAYNLEQSYLLPDVRQTDAEGHYVGSSDEAIAAIKEQLNEGRAVSIAVGISTADFYNADTGAFYNDSDGKGAAHAMTVVGYDDNYAISNFKEGQQPDKPGAFLVKNSYGASTNEFPNYGEYGEKDADGNYTGYIWVSYYDHTLADVAAYDYDVNSATSAETFEADQYNFLANQTTLVRASDEKVSSANVFEVGSDSDRVLRALSCETAKLNTQATYEVYLLGDDAESPTDGTLALSKTVDYEYGGYHRLLLGDDEQLAMRAGQRYSVVVTLKAQIDGAEKYYQTAGKSSKCADSVRPVLKIGDFVSKVNAGESYSLEADGQWSDWTVVTSALAEEQVNCCVDNPPIKAFYQERDLASNEELAALKQAVADAQAKLDAAHVSADGADVDPAQTWVTQEAHDALAAAIAEARATLGLAGDFETKLAGTTPSSATVASATEALTSASASFSPKAGTKTADDSDDKKDDKKDDSDKSDDKSNGGASDTSGQTAQSAAKKSKLATPSTGDTIVAAPVALLAASGLGSLLAAARRRRAR